MCKKCEKNRNIVFNNTIANNAITNNLDTAVDNTLVLSPYDNKFIAELLTDHQITIDRAKKFLKTTTNTELSKFTTVMITSLKQDIKIIGDIQKSSRRAAR